MSIFWFPQLFSLVAKQPTRGYQTCRLPNNCPHTLDSGWCFNVFNDLREQHTSQNSNVLSILLFTPETTIKRIEILAVISVIDWLIWDCVLLLCTVSLYNSLYSSVFFLYMENANIYIIIHITQVDILNSKPHKYLYNSSYASQFPHHSCEQSPWFLQDCPM